MNKFIKLAFLLFVGMIFAQQDPQYTNYMYNMDVINPAYAGSRETISGGILYRDQYSGFEGAPETKTFFINSPVGEKVGLGLSFINDEIGPVKENNVYVDFSYRLDLGINNHLAFGVKGGVTNHDIGAGDLATVDDLDPKLVNTSEWSPNVGTGVYYYTDKFYASASVPNIIESRFLNKEDELYKFGDEKIHFFLTSGYVFDLSQNVKLKPSFLLKTVFPSSFDISSLDINTNVLLYDKLELGVSYRMNDSFSGLFNVKVLPELRVGYAYDAVTSDISKIANSSHEFFLLFDLNFKKRVFDSPRFF